MTIEPLKTLFFMILFPSVILAAATAAADADSGPFPTTNVLRFGVHVSEMGTLDPHFAAGSQDRAVADMIFNGLLRYQPGDAPKIEPDLAERIPDFEMINGRQVWTIKLRQGVFFHAGPSHDNVSSPPPELHGSK